MQYVGIQSQINRNNFNSVLLLIAFPILLLAMVYAFIFFIGGKGFQQTNQGFLMILPWVLIGVSIWFAVAWFFNSKMIQFATGAKSLDRRTNKRVYNLLENLCIAQGMPMPKLFVINDSSLNAYASGLKPSQYAVTLSQGIIDKLDDDELESVMAHELTHIINKDVQLLVISIIFVGIFAFIAESVFRSLRFGGRSSDGRGSAAVILIAVVISAIAYFLSILMRFGISRSREYMADAGSAEMTKNPMALASALRKIANDPAIEALENRDVAQLFIDNPKPSAHGFSWDNLFTTHPPIEKRIAVLEQFVNS
ncbi:MAG: protease [Flavobacteriia bacterium]|nr:MAG: protease [Flavobacteriia bacterium]